MNSNNYLINFTIPQGPTGPAGPSSGIETYGGKYNNSSQTINLNAGNQSQIPLPLTLPNNNITYTTTNSITVPQAGTYEITFYTNLSATVVSTITLSVRNNGTNIPSSIISRPLSINNNTIFSGTTLVTLTANSIIDMALSASTGLGITLSSGVNANLTIKKLR